MAKNITITLSIPEPGDPLPHVVIENNGHKLIYSGLGSLCCEWGRWVIRRDDVADALDIPSQLPDDYEAAE